MDKKSSKYELWATLQDGAVREIEKEEYTSFLKHKELLVFFIRFEELFEIVKENFRDFWRTIFEITEDYRLHMFRDRNFVTKNISNLNLRIANILNSFKAYDDHLKHHLSSNFDNHIYSDFFDLFKNKVYDKSFEYRFCVRLRNYVQHFGHPVDKMSCQTFMFRKEISEMAFTTRPIIYKRKLLQYDGWSTVKKDIESLDEEIDLTTILESFFRALGYIHSNVRNELGTVYNASKGFIERLYKECQKYLVEKERNNDPIPDIICYQGGKMYSDWVPYELIETIEIFRNQNANYSPSCNSFTTLQSSRNINKIQNILDDYSNGTT